MPKKRSRLDGPFYRLTVSGTDPYRDVRLGWRRAVLNRYKRMKGCADCGERDVIVLQFDHRPAEERLFAIGSSYCRRWDVLKAEVLKCDVVCANCHVRRSMARGQHNGHKTDGFNYGRKRWQYAKA